MNKSWENYAEDREHLLLALRRKGVRGWVPAQLVRDAILECGWRIERAYGLEPSLLGLCCGLLPTPAGARDSRSCVE